MGVNTVDNIIKYKKDIIKYKVIDKYVNVKILDDSKLSFNLGIEDVPGTIVPDISGKLTKEMIVIPSGIRLLNSSLVKRFNPEVVECCDLLKEYPPTIEVVHRRDKLEILLMSHQPSTLTLADVNYYSMVIDLGIPNLDLVEVTKDNLTLKDLMVDHSYVPYSDDVDTWGSMADFLSEYGDADIDYNRCIRWDVTPVSDDDIDVENIVFKVLINHQREGTVKLNIIRSVSDNDLNDFLNYLHRMADYNKKLWEPIDVLKFIKDLPDV